MKEKETKVKKEEEVPLDVYDGGPVRVVTEADILADSRLVAASVVVGQLYDFSNLPFVKDGAIEADVQGYNQAHKDAEKREEAVVVPQFTSEAEREALGVDEDGNKLKVK